MPESPTRRLTDAGGIIFHYNETRDISGLRSPFCSGVVRTVPQSGMGPGVQTEEGTHPLPGTVLTTQRNRPEGLRYWTTAS
jgi:hypothetical protein